MRKNAKALLALLCVIMAMLAVSCTLPFIPTPTPPDPTPDGEWAPSDIDVDVIDAEKLSDSVIFYATGLIEKATALNSLLASAGISGVETSAPGDSSAKYKIVIGMASYKASELAKAMYDEAAANAPEEKKERVYGDPDPVEPISTDMVSMDDFSKMDIRVCKIVKVQEIRKSHSCYKLTLHDGIDERVIVSSIKHDYTADELVGKKIIVLANLAPTRITGVTSNGMLLAATNNACGTQVIFVDDRVPEGTKLH